MRLFIKNLKKHITLPKVLTGISICLFIYFIRTYVLIIDVLVIRIIILESNIYSCNISRDLFLGLSAVPLRLLFLGIWEEILGNSSK